MTESTASGLMSAGTKHLSAQNFEAAKNCFLQAVEADSTESEGYFFLSWIAHQEKQGQVACGYLKKALEIQPFNKKYLSGLANIYSQLGEVQKAIELYQGYLRMDSSQAEIYYHYACVLAQTKELGSAFEAFQQAIRLDPDQLPFYMAFGQLLFRINQYRDAQKVYLSALSRGLKSEGLYQNIAKLHADFGELEEAKQVLFEASNVYPDDLSFIYRLSTLEPNILVPSLYQRLKTKTDETLSPDNQFYRNWLLSKFNDNDPTVELEYLVKAHSIFKDINRFAVDKDMYLNILSELDLPEIKNIEALRNDDSKNLEPIFIIGVPRCGSTLIENIIVSGPETVLKGEETGALFHSLTTQLKKNANGSQEHDFWVDLRTQLKAIYQGANLLQENHPFTDKSLENIFLIDLILIIYPKAKIIYCERQPLASIVSILKNNMATLPWAHDVQDIFNYVSHCLEAIKKWNEKYPGVIHTVSYENLVTEPEAESKRLMAYCGLEWNESCLMFHENKNIMSKTASHIQVRNKINQDALTGYEKYESFFEPYLAQYPALRINN